MTAMISARWAKRLGRQSSTRNNHIQIILHGRVLLTIWRRIRKNYVRDHSIRKKIRRWRYASYRSGGGGLEDLLRNAKCPSLSRVSGEIHHLSGSLWSKSMWIFQVLKRCPLYLCLRPFGESGISGTGNWQETDGVCERCISWNRALHNVRKWCVLFYAGISKRRFHLFAGK